MSINLQQPIVPMTTVKMFDAKNRLIGIPKQKVQVILTLSNIQHFNDALHATIYEMQDITECFILTTSSFDDIEVVIEEYQLDASMISSDFKSFAKTFDVQCRDFGMKDALIIIDKNCQITHKDIL